MNLVNPAVTDGVNLFVTIVVLLIAFANAISFVNSRKEGQKGKK